MILATSSGSMRFIKTMERVTARLHEGGPYTVYENVEHVQLRRECGDPATRNARWASSCAGPCFLVERDGVILNPIPFPADGSMTRFLESLEGRFA